MKNTASVYVLLFSLLTSAATSCSPTSIAANEFERKKALAREESDIFKADRQIILNKMNPKKYSKTSAMSYFSEKAFDEASIDARNANSIPGYRRTSNQSDLTNPNRIVVGSAAWATASKK